MGVLKANIAGVWTAIPMWANREGPRGSVGYAHATSSTWVTSGSTESDITASVGPPPSLALDLDPTRLYRAFFVARFLPTVANDFFTLRFYDALAVRQVTATQFLSASTFTVRFETVFIPQASGTVVYKMTGQRPTGTGTVSIVASSGGPMVFSIEDIGKV